MNKTINLKVMLMLRMKDFILNSEQYQFQDQENQEEDQTCQCNKLI